MAARIPLPAPLDATPFVVGQATKLGVGRGRLAGRDLRKPYRGVRSAVNGQAADLYAPRLRSGDRFSHTTALRLWGAPLPARHENAVHVTSSPGSRHRMVGISGHESDDAASERRHGHPVSTAPTAFLEAATILELDDLVAVADYLILDPHVLDPHDLRPYSSLAELEVRARRYRGRGARLARSAVELAREGVESPRETTLRLLLGRAGLPEPQCGFELIRPTGRPVGWFDLAWPEFRVIAEYDGDQHRTSKAQYERDIWRFDQADALGWKVIRVRDAGIRAPRSTANRVASALSSRGWTPRRQSNRLAAG